MPKLTINGQEIEVPPGTTVMQACEGLGIEIPRFCYHEKLSIAGSCRMCLVEIEKMPKPVASCTMPCAEGMVIRTDTAMVKKARAGVLEMTLLNHPLDCPVCDQGGECDLQDFAFAYGRTACRSKEKRRLVTDKELGPLIKTVMTRCIHCTRCVRFMREVAGVEALGGLFRGEAMEIAPGAEGLLTSELSGNLADVCPVGALTSKPFAFKARSWEMTRTSSVDVLDAVGSAIRVDSRGGQVMRILPRRNDAVNEVWINDKTRYACDGLAVGRLETPLIRQDGVLMPAEWDEALELVARRMKSATPGRMAALVGDLADCEAMFALKSLMDALDCPNTDCRQDGALYDATQRCGTIMNSSIEGIDKADALILVGVNPRHEAALVNARIFKRWRKGGCAIGLIGASADLTYPYEMIGHSPMALRDLGEGKYPFADVLRKAKNPMVIVGSGALARPDGPEVHALARDLAIKLGMVRDDWCGFNVLQRAASRVGGLDLGFVPASYGKATGAVLEAAGAGDMSFLYLLGADELPLKRHEKTFVVYQGHHADRGAALADVVLPGAAYTEKDALYVNTEGRPQRTRRAVAPPGDAREDWRILGALAEAIGADLGWTDEAGLAAALTARCPHFAQEGALTPTPWKPFGGAARALALHPFEPVVENFYKTDSISRASPTMAACTAQILPLLRKKEAR